MSERTVTEQQVIAAFNKHCPNLIPQYRIIFSELFPEQPDPPLVGEVIRVWNISLDGAEGWGNFLYIDKDGQVCTEDECGAEWLWDNYRRQTPTERGES